MMQLTYLSHSCFLLEVAGHRILIDPFLTGNPLAPVAAAAVQCDHILLSHGHDDHCGDALGIAQRCRATIVAPHELAEYFADQGATVHGMNPGGGWNFPFGRVKFTPAIHSSSTGPAAAPVYLGQPCGILVEAAGKRLYHAGDTALFSDMRLLARGGLDVALLPIGDNYTMGPEDAVEAMHLLQPKLAVPMHYNTFPPIRTDPQVFAHNAAAAGFTVRVMAPGERITV